MTLENENLCSHKNLHTKVYGNSIHNRQKLEKAQMSFDSQMDKQNVVLLCNRILFSNKKNKPLTRMTIWMNHKDILSISSQSQWLYTL